MMNIYIVLMEMTQMSKLKRRNVKMKKWKSLGK